MSEQEESVVESVAEAEPVVDTAEDASIAAETSDQQSNDHGPMSPASGTVSQAVEDGAKESTLPENSAAVEEVPSDTEEASSEETATQDLTPSADEVSPANEQTGGDASAAESEGADKKKVVRTLSVGQEMTGTVKRLADFGAFVDIGVGRDGLLHISELSLQRVSKVADVLSQGQEVTVWIKELNREKNRISLTMISPDTKTIRDLKKDDIVEGTVTRMMPYGAFIDIGIGRDALLHVREMGEGFIKSPEEILSIGEELEARIIEISRRRGRVDLSIKGLRPEPESEEEAVEREAEGEFVDEFENVEPMSAIELALKKAMEATSDSSVQRSKRKQRKSKRTRQNTEIDDIISRTLKNADS